MATSLFQSRKSRRSGVRTEVENIEDQLAQLRGDIAALAKALARETAQGVSDARGKVESKVDSARDQVTGIKDRAESDIHDLIAAGEDILADFRDRYRDSGKQVRQTVKDHPLATIGAAAAVGFVIAALFRR